MTSIFSNDAESRLQRSLQALRREIDLVIEGRSDRVNLAPDDQQIDEPAAESGGSFEDTVRKAIARLTELFGIGR